MSRSQPSNEGVRARVAGRLEVQSRTAWMLEIGPLRIRCIREKDGTCLIVQAHTGAGWDSEVARGIDAHVLLQSVVNSKGVKLAFETLVRGKARSVDSTNEKTSVAQEREVVVVDETLQDDSGEKAPITIAARDFAFEKHAAQRYGDQPYTVHLTAVREVLQWAGYSDGHSLATAAWLHDVIEDTPTTREEVARLFGETVAELVWAVTGVGPNRKTRNANAYAKIRACPAAATLKLADRIANVEASLATADKLTMYRKEWPEFEAALTGYGRPTLWDRLRTLLGVA